MSASSEPPNESPAPGSHYQPALSVVLIILVLFVATTFLMLRSSSPAAPGVPTSSNVTTTSKPGRSTSSTVPKAKVRVQVANGTLTSGLARTYTQQLMTLSWDTLPQLNAARVASTIVYYNPGFRWAAQEIATEIQASSSSIQPLNGLTPVPGASGDDVIVILGPDVALHG